MTAPNIFLGLSMIGLLLSLNAYARVRLSGRLMIANFFFGWLRGELVLWTLVLEGLLTLGFMTQGALDAPAGQVGLGLAIVSWALLFAVHARSVRAGEELATALSELGLTADRKVSAFHGFPNPFQFGHPDVKRIQDVEYGESLPGDQGGRNLLDLIVPKAASDGDLRPVLQQVHGGAWMMGDKREQGRPLMREMAARGWVCVAINYRLSPKGTMPDHIVDVKRSIAWIRANIAAYGGDPDFVCITGGSAGGHLSSLAALTANDPRFQPGFERVDTRLDACVPFYGVFDFLDRADDRSLGKMVDAIGPQVFKCTPEENPELWDAVCPVVRVHAESPPFFVIQGSHDSLVMTEEADTFVAALREKSTQPVLHSELVGAQHAFEVLQSPRTEHAVLAVAAFLENVRSEQQVSKA